MSSQDMPYLKEYYQKTVAPNLKKSRGYKNDYEIPLIEKIVLNAGVSAVSDKGVLDETIKNMSLVAGQLPIKTLAKNSISNFKLRDGMEIGCKVTLRGARMWDFLFRLIAIALPSIRDFRGLPNRLDGHGNYSIGVNDITIFPEVSVDSIKRQSGLEITIVTTASKDDEGQELLSELGMPFRKRDPKQESDSEEPTAA